MHINIYKNFYVEFIKSCELDINIFIKLFFDGYDIGIKKIESKVKKLKQSYENDPEIDIDDMVSGDYEEITVTPKYFLNICCVILYSDLEKKLKGILENIFEIDLKKNEYYKFFNMQKVFISKNVDLTKLNDYDYINELRELNNCIKHDGYVSDTLEKLSKNKYRIGQEIDISKEIIVSYSKNINNFLNDLYKEVKTFIITEQTAHNRSVCASPPYGGSGYEKTQSG